ncbi:MAG: cytidylate kinase-like family protein [Coriobacteriia bacterium]|nr:cytidylate kinase-like family protein [Coriobacteriia bacterium]
MTKRIITISRQYGSGGREIGERVARQLGYAFYDKDIVRRAAKEGGFDEDLVKEGGEGIHGVFSSLMSYANTVVGKDEDSLPLHDRIFLTQARIIKQIASEGPCVIVGRSAEYVLADYPDLLNVYIHSEWDARVKRVMERNGLSEHDAEARIRKTDRQRAVFYEQRTDQKWGMAANYHLSVSSSSFGIDATVDLIARIATRY